MEVVSTRGGGLPASLETLKLGKALGKGGFAVVRSGTLRTADGAAFPVAVKVLHPEYSDESSQELRLFKDEAALMLQLSHRNIITAYGLLKLPPNFPGLDGHTAPAYALILEMMEGGSLARLMVKQVLAGGVPKYTFSQALGWLIDVASALQYLHNGGKDGFPRIHRDVKLENVLLTAGMRTAKLADFGLQRAIFAQHPGQQHHQPQQPQHQQTAMLVRRSVRTPISSMPRGGPAGPSRLAPESERTSQRQREGSAAKLTLLQPQPPAAPSQRCWSSPTNFVAAVCSEAAEELLATDTLFYAVDNNGLTPVVLPHSPQQQQLQLQLQRPSPRGCRPQQVVDAGAGAAAGDLQGLLPDSRLGLGLGPPSGGGGRVCRQLQLEQQIARRSRSTSQLEQLGGDKDTWPAALVAVASSARERVAAGAAAAAASAAAAAAGVPGQSPSAGDVGRTTYNNNVGKSSKDGNDSANRVVASSFLERSDSGPGLQVALPHSPACPASPARRGTSPRSLVRGPAGASPAATRPSPLGPSPPLLPPARCASSGDGDDGASLAGDSPRSQPRTPTPAGSSPLVSERGPGREPESLTCSPAGPASASDAASAPAAPYTSASVPCGSDLTSVSGRQSPAGLTPSALCSQGSGLAALEAGRQSLTSLREVVLEAGPCAVRLPPPGQEQEQRPAPPLQQQQQKQAGSMRQLGSTAPGAFAGDGGVAAANAADAAAASSGRLQLLTSAAGDADSGRRGAGAPAAIADAGVAVAPGTMLRPTLSAAAGSAVPLVAVDSAARSDFFHAGAPRAGTASGMLGGGGAGGGASGLLERERSSLGQGRGAGGRVRRCSTRISIVTPAVAGGGGDDAVEAAAAATAMLTGTAPISPCGSTTQVQQQQPQQQQQLQLVDVLHLRLGPQNFGVRSVRSSASGGAQLNRQQPAGSAPSSPRGLAAAAAARAAAAGAVAGAGGPQEAAAVARSVRRGSLPGGLTVGRWPSGGVKAVADFEEVFSLTGRTGSLVYLAPEAYKNEPYNDKVDVYSLAVLTYELFGRTSITYTHISTKLPAFSRMICNPDEFAERVAAGYRPPRTNAMARLPPQLWELIEAGWHQDPVQRPDISALLQGLQELVEPLAEAEAEAAGGRGHLGAARCGCVVC
ncbi:hypothetical protein PLESTB_001215500 [Pleodorina starrii]|uniref:Protein kinase domain-containing protein n=1 Tax=Pleodorina starrii TaxID=330485 RepID=A0A9W6BSW0_9CHLO|nr:hypothetical protein PLESTM_001643900 [Pleodorina starrii]GLC57355.1 hypothetical protein PLESTB_001215500 [Pleodorina starrii]GLC71247.1 hypothetical protein PLESTF_001094600 [Pleodorina starrii]